MYTDAYDEFISQANIILSDMRYTANEYRLIFGKDSINNCMMYYKMGSFSAMISGLRYLKCSAFFSSKEEDEMELLTMKLDNEWRYLFLTYVTGEDSVV